MVDVIFSIFGRLPRDPKAFAVDTFHTARELGLVYNREPHRGRYFFQDAPHSGSTVVDEHASGDPRGDRFAAAVDAAAAHYWPHVFMAVEIPSEEGEAARRSSTLSPVTLAMRELPRVDAPLRYQGSPFYEITLTTPVGPLIDVEREEEAEQGLHWFVSQVFLPLFISREALYATADFDPSAAREVTPRHLEKLLIPDFFFLNVLGPSFVKKFGVEPFLNARINPPDLQRRWLMRTPEGALLFRAKTETDRWNGPADPPVDFYEWEGRFRILEGIVPKKTGRGKGA